MFKYVIIIHNNSQNVHKKVIYKSTMLPTMHVPPALPSNLIHKGRATNTVNLDQDLH